MKMNTAIVVLYMYISLSFLVGCQRIVNLKDSIVVLKDEEIKTQQQEEVVKAIKEDKGDREDRINTLTVVDKEQNEKVELIEMPVDIKEEDHKENEVISIVDKTKVEPEAGIVGGEGKISAIATKTESEKQSPQKINTVNEQPKTHLIDIPENSTKFIPGEIIINIRDTVEWINNDHSRDKHLFISFPDVDMHVEIPLTKLYAGQKVAFTFNRLGEFPYYCFIHKEMKGKITVVRPGQTVEEMLAETNGGMKINKDFIPEKRVSNKDMILIPAGYFIMGNPNNPVESPPEQIYLEDFYIDKYEVTNAEFAEFVNATGYKVEGKWKEYYIKGTEEHPAVGVTWNDANAFAYWVGKRLPTEEQWEKAARGTDTRSWAWGDSFDSEITNIFGDDDYAGTAPVGSFEQDVSPFGVHDIAGNVSEWTANYFLPYKNNTHKNEFVGKENFLVIRGGSFTTLYPEQATTHARVPLHPKKDLQSVGFRCVRTNHDIGRLSIPIKTK